MDYLTTSLISYLFGSIPFGYLFTKILLKKDIRDLTRNDLLGCDAVIHLAALSNDPLGDISATITNEINYEATIQLGKLAKAANVPRFVFSSSCSSYGANEEIVNENSPLVPLTAYAKSKVKQTKKKDNDLTGTKLLCSKK